ncbi:MAG: alpha-mannosidase [Phycisphaerae bacterium]|nr:alpha-mannosidase [Phycisphaerae bacterium]
MALDLEWRDRLKRWRDELSRHIEYRLGDVDFEFFVTKDRLTYDEAMAGAFAPCPAGTKWGRMWEYGWFHANITLPAEARRRRVYLRPNVVGESLVYIDGQVAGSVSRQPIAIALTSPRPTIDLTRNGKSGQKISVLIECYAGHGVPRGETGPVPPGRQVVQKPEGTQLVVEQGEFGLWEEDVYQLHVDVETLFQLRENIDKESLRVSEIDEALREFTRIVDFELPREEFLATVREARKMLAPLLAKTNGPTAPTLYGFGHGHLDVAWLWPLAETDRKEARTLGNQLALADEYEGYNFLNSQTHLFWRIQQKYPQFWERVKQGVKDGKIIADGAWWVEADTNISSGESLIRQALYGKKFFREEFGLDSRVLWLPDVFGYSGALPQILNGCGVDYFATAKIFWTYHGGDPFPYNTFWWEGVDGTRILVHLVNDYGEPANPYELIRRWNQRVQKDGITSRLFPFGFSDGGGGPNRDHVEFARRCADLEGCPKLKLSTPREFFNDIEEQGGIDNVYVGELYYQGHRGTYTSQAKTKQGNRRSEIALREAELWSTAAAVLKKHRIDRETLWNCWRQVMLHQFHDILPGSSIARVYEEAEAEYARVLKELAAVTGKAAGALTDNAKDAITLFNSLSWDRKSLIALPAGWNGATDADGDTLCVQEVEGVKYVETEILSMGLASLKKADASASAGCRGCGGVQAEKTRLENDLVRATFNERGELVSLVAKDTGMEFLAGPSNQFRMYKDVPSQCDAWDIDSMYEQTPVELQAEARVEVVCSGPLLGKVRVTRKINGSEMSQDITLRRGQRRVEFATVIDWNEKHKLLKVAFDSNIHANEAIHEIQYGYIARPNHRSRPFDRDRFEVCNHRFTALCEQRRGLAVLNDCKYGVSTLGGCIQLTLLRSAQAPDDTADLGRQEFTYAVTAWEGAFGDSHLTRQGYELNVPVTAVAGSAERTSLFSLDADNVIIDAVKPAEDGSGDVIVRLYESLRTATNCMLSAALPVKAARQTDMLENKTGDLTVSKGSIALSFRPFEIKTVRLQTK